MRIRFALVGLALAGAMSASAAPRATIAPGQGAYQIETHVIGSGGYSMSSDEDYVLDATIGEWSVGMVKSSSSIGYAIDGGFWPYMSKADCSGATPSWGTDLSVCH
jgi:hypothetical protein